MTKPSETTQTSGAKQTISLVFFGNEKLVTGQSSQPIIQDALTAAGFTVEKTITGNLSTLGTHQSTIAVLAAYGHIIPQSILDEFPLGIINIHPSLLPLYRGPTPIESAILDGATKTGVSIMKLTSGMDEGPVYQQKSIALNGTESKHQLAAKLQLMGAEMLVDLLPGIASGTIRPRAQPHPDRATYSQKLTKQNSRLDFTEPATALAREIRAFAEWPKSRATIDGNDIVVMGATVDSDASGVPGALFKNTNKQLGIYCGTGALIVHTLKPSGKQAMTAEGFLAGYGKHIPLRD